MPFIIEENDITTVSVDAIVNAANSSLLGGGGVDGAIHRAAGPGLLRECRKLGGCGTGEAKATRAYRLPAKYVIHTVGPVYRGGGFGEEELLRSCYRSSLRLACELGCESVAFPLISAGVYGYPADEAVAVARSEILAFLEEHEMLVKLIIFDRRSFRIDPELLGDIREYVDDNYRGPRAEPNSILTQKEDIVQDKAHRPYSAAKLPFAAPFRPKQKESAAAPAPGQAFGGYAGEAAAEAAAYADPDLDEMLSRLDESFSQNLLRRITASGMTDAECYKRANVDRKLFSKIRSDAGYRPSKPTVLAFAVALKLNIEETEDLLRRAGFALTRSKKFDVIVEYFIRRGRYDLYEINDALFAFDQPLLGN